LRGLSFQLNDLYDKSRDGGKSEFTDHDVAENSSTHGLVLDLKLSCSWSISDESFIFNFPTNTSWIWGKVVNYDIEIWNFGHHLVLAHIPTS
jgi:hypothetical protein